jgi:dTDP-4-dehydrorhamnose reductase
MLGATLVPLLRRERHEVLGAGRSSSAEVRLDLLDAQAIFKVLLAHKPDVVLNLAALTDVDRCERMPQEAFTANVRSVENLVGSLAAMDKPAFLVHISTDHVYDGPGHHREDDVTLVNYYAYSKYAGEIAARGISAAVLRTNFFGRSAAPTRASFSDWIVNALRRGETINVFEDVFFNPLSMPGLGAIVSRVIDRRPAGVFNVGSRGAISKADFAFRVAEVLSLQTRTMQRSMLRDATTLARRPLNMLMDSSCAESTLGLRMPEIRDEILSLRGQYDEV